MGGAGPPERMIDRVRWAAKALQVLLKPSQTRRPIILDGDRRKIEALCFSINTAQLPGYRSALETFGVITQLGRHKAWVVNPLTDAQLDLIGGTDLEPEIGGESDEAGS